MRELERDDISLDPTLGALQHPSAIAASPPHARALLGQTRLESVIEAGD